MFLLGDPEVVVKYISSSGSKLTLIHLSQKTCMLLLLSTAHGGQTIHKYQWGWMDDLRSCVFFNISVISGRWTGDNE